MPIMCDPTCSVIVDLGNHYHVSSIAFVGGRFVDGVLDESW